MNTTADTTTTETVEAILTEQMNGQHPESRLLSAIISTEWNRQSVEKDALRAARQIIHSAERVAAQIEAGQHTSDFVTQEAQRLAEVTRERAALNERLSMLIHCINDDELRTRLADAR